MDNENATLYALAMARATTYMFGSFRLEPEEGRLLRDGEPVALRPKVFDALVALVRRRGRLAEKSALIHEIWPDSAVEESNLASTVSELRQVLGDSRADVTYIETVPKRGYRFVAEVQVLSSSAASTEGPPPEQEIFFTTSSDGVRIAYAVAGKGSPLVKTANWLNHLEFDWHSPVWVHLMRELSRDHTLVRYDERGNGLSDWQAHDLSFEAFVADLESVVEAAGIDRFPLLGISQGCAVAVAYAVRHPERVTRMVLHGGYARGWRLRGEEADRSLVRGLVEAIRTGWGRDVEAFRQLFAAIYIPSGTPEQQQWWIDLQRVSTSPENAARLLEAWGSIDVSDVLTKVSVPTLVSHCRRDVGVPFEFGRGLAAGIPGARFLPLDSDNHLILEHEPAWAIWLAAVREFLAENA